LLFFPPSHLPNFLLFRIPHSQFHIQTTPSPSLPLTPSPTLPIPFLFPHLSLLSFRIPHSQFRLPNLPPSPSPRFSLLPANSISPSESGIRYLASSNPSSPPHPSLPLTHPPFLRVSPPKIPLFSTLLGFFSATALTYGEQNRVDSHIVQPGANSTRSHAESFSKNGFFFSNK